MYNTTSTIGGVTHREQDSKYTVADILSSMASGEPPISNPTYSHKYSYGLGGVTTVTPTLTPTTLTNIEQTFIELQSVPGPESSGHNRHFQSGFVPPLIEPMTGGEHSQKKDPDWSPPGGKKMKTNARTAVLSEADIYTPGYLSTSRKPPQRRKDEKNCEEVERRRVRRERNKVAAAKCRQRRVDHTNVLVGETDQLDNQRNELENEIQSLQQQKEHLEFLLQAHRPLCKLQNHCAMRHTAVSSGECLPKVKAEPQDFVDDSVVPYTVAGYKPRPNSLPLKVETSMPNTSAALGVPITTPSSGIFTFGLDSIVDGHTGLTPLTGIASCSSQVHRHGGSDSSPEQLKSPTLISL